MDRLVFLLLSIVLTVLCMYVIPLGLAKKEKNLIAVSASLIGSLGLFSYSIAAFWQVLLVMVLLAISTGYLMVSRSSSMNSPVPLINRLSDSNVQAKNYIENSFGISHQDDDAIHDNFVQPFIELNPFSNEFSNKDETDFDLLEEEDISFLEDRNRIKTDDQYVQNELELQVVNYDDDRDYFEEQTAAGQLEK